MGFYTTSYCLVPWSAFFSSAFLLRKPNKAKRQGAVDATFGDRKRRFTVEARAVARISDRELLASAQQSVTSTR